MISSQWFHCFAFSAALSLCGCALLTKSAPITPRYFAPRIDTDAASEQKVPEAAVGRRLRLGRINAGPHLRERMAYRSSDTEVGYREERRWTERPDAYLQRALARSLFEEHRIDRAVSGAAPTLDAELVAFEEVLKPKHHVRVEVIFGLDDTVGGYLQRTIKTERDVEGDDDDPEAVVHALSQALEVTVSEISRAVIDKLAEIPVAPAAAGETPIPAAETKTTTTLSTTTESKPITGSQPAPKRAGDSKDSDGSKPKR